MSKFFKNIMDRLETSWLDGVVIAVANDGFIDSVEIYGNDLKTIDLAQLDTEISYICQTDDIPTLGKYQKEGVFVLNGNKWKCIKEIEMPDELLGLDSLEGKAVLFLDVCHRYPVCGEEEVMARMWPKI